MNQVLGIDICYNWPWTDVEVVYVPFHVSSLQHWVLIVVNLSSWTMDVYDSMYQAGLHNNRVIQAVKPASDFIPIVVEKVGLFD